ncbi:hypothetical protein [Borreliella tanukii]|uniref:hypothetical protein n=1 Tax=Borreliella tanukii TaxID=56146 RepID=UPI0026491154|nr:hypothetical protein [Borreliella tanukii]WKC79418.1 hypothetical protein QIA28_00465 [Borreliella tanukii]WKC80337.1 hypothetical protein QIA29_00455 [Borreliella tanukii]WKC81250.1 hypothetical protein QIA27_00450 [Borreliella tanukii]
MVKKIIFISFLVFMMSCNAIGRGVLIDSILNKMVKDLDQEEKEEKKEKENSHSNPATNENADDDSEEEEDIE